MVVSLEYVAKSKSAMPLEKLPDTEFSPKGSKVHVYSYSWQYEAFKMILSKVFNKIENGKKIHNIYIYIIYIFIAMWYKSIRDLIYSYIY